MQKVDDRGQLPRFKTVEDALVAIAKDGLACVYVRATEVWVATAYGTGKFDKKDWEARKGRAMR